jgi:hypothetical protein
MAESQSYFSVEAKLEHDKVFVLMGGSVRCHSYQDLKQPAAQATHLMGAIVSVKCMSPMTTLIVSSSRFDCIPST